MHDDAEQSPITTDRPRRLAVAFDPAWHDDRCYPFGWSRIAVDDLAGLRRGAVVVSAAGFVVGVVDGFVVDGDEATHLVLQAGHAFGARDVALPIGRIRVDGERVRVLLSREAIDELPAVTPQPGLRQGRRGVADRHRRSAMRRRALLGSPTEMFGPALAIDASA